MNHPDPEQTRDGARVERQVNKLVNERGALFDKARTSRGLSDVDRHRLVTVERELDECFLARRRLRADRDANRFDRDRPSIRRSLPPKTTP